MELCVKTALRAAAARPLDERGRLLVDEEPVFKQFAAGTALFRLHPVFQGAAFKELAVRVRAAEDSTLVLPELDPTVASPVALRVEKVIVPLQSRVEDLSTKVMDRPTARPRRS